MPRSSHPAPLAVLVKGYPRVSETFVAHELAALERRGATLTLAALRRPYDALTHPVHAAVRAPVLYLPEYLRDEPGRVLRSHARVAGRAPRGYLRALGAWLRDLARDPTPSRVRRFGQAGVLAAELPASVQHLHAHFLHTPASVARYAARMRGLGLSLSAHAKDIWTTPAWDLRGKLREARLTVACTAAGRDRLRSLAPEARVALVHHGLDRTLFAPPATFGSARDGRDPGAPVRLVTVGRFQPKKGFDVLLRAVARVTRHVTLTVVGYGPLEGTLRAQAAALGLATRITWSGPLAQPAVRACYRASDLFVLGTRTAADGDRDGLPNVVVEALSQGLPVVATRAGAIAEAVEDGIHGRLVPPEDPEALARAIDALAADPAARRRLGAAGIARVARDFDLEVATDRLVTLLAEAGIAVGAPPAAGAPAVATR